MRKHRLLFLAFTVFATAGTAVAADRARLLDLSVDEFNAPDKAWRINEAQRDYHGAGKLLEAYLAKHGAQLPNYEFTLMHFHAMQMFAAHGDTARALSHEVPSKFKVEPPDWPVPWNDYVDATVAFLRRDREAFLRARSRIEATTERGGRAGTLSVIERLLANFDKPYSIAYGFTVEPRQPNQALEPTATAVTDRAAHAPRQP
jgi:hypothetical protein